ncbi:phage tail protein [Hymenobacter artigasi]|uniref:Phage tail-like protein n=1 Tax=Hymenobacter artigasi TaxID=2719616 RepID=A0ABX1HNI4_9BACT|nr:phage tail protein [Hymenobacter artigasi]NKI91819.1 phage tail-like protein [Hymenobacter artigasi]
MADDSSAQNHTIWPLAKFYFQVDGLAGGVGNYFAEVSGLDTETEVIEYRHGNSENFSTIKMPGLRKVGNVTLKKGIFVKDNKFWDWFNAIKMNTPKRQTVVIKLLDESGAPTMTWTLNNAWPTKITGTDLKADGNEVAIETLELAYETLSIANG